MGGTTPILQSRTPPLLPFRISKSSNALHGPLHPDTCTSTFARRSGLVKYGTNGVIPLRPLTLLVLALLFSMLFTIAVSFSFLGYDTVEPYFKQILNDVAETNPGIVLLGENVDVDVDEPSIGIRWSILGCGNGYVLEGSAGVHGSDLCGLPSFYLEIYVDSSIEPTATYDPSHLPFVSQTGRRRVIQNLVQFDSDHTLDVHLDRLYPFDNYVLTSTLRAVSASNVTIPIQKLATIEQVSSFVVESVDTETYEVVSPSSSTQIPTRDIDLYVSRPAQARAFALLLFTLSWCLTHATLMCIYLAQKRSTWHVPRSAKPILKHLGGSLMVLLVIPQLRNAMPDAPGYDGVLIDCIGFFPQMIFSGLSVLILLLLVILRELEGMEDEDRQNESNIGIDADEQSTPHSRRATLSAKLASPPSLAAFCTDPTPDPKPWTKTESGLNPSPSPLKRLILGTKRRHQTQTPSISLERGHLLRDENDMGNEDFDTNTPSASSTLAPASSSPSTAVASASPLFHTTASTASVSFSTAPRSSWPSDSEEIAHSPQQQPRQRHRSQSWFCRTRSSTSSGSGGRPGCVYRYELARLGSQNSLERTA